MTSISSRLLLTTLLLLPAPFAMAQAIYKVVGPDGKVTFSDKPDGEGAQAVDVKVPPSSRQSAAVDEAPAYSPAERAAEAYRAKRAAAAAPARTTMPAPPQKATIQSDLLKAIMNTMALEDLVSQSERLCLQTLPTSFKRYSGATEGWGKRNEPALARYRKVLQTLTYDQRNKMTELVKQQTASVLTVVEKAPTYSRIKWCDQSVDELNQGKLDIARKPDLWGPLMQAR